MEKTQLVRSRRGFATKSSVVMYEALSWKRKAERTTGIVRKQERKSAQLAALTSVSAIYHLV